MGVEDELLDPWAVAERLGVSRSTLERMVRCGEFPPPDVAGHHIFWNRFTVRRWVRRAVLLTRVVRRFQRH